MKKITLLILLVFLTGMVFSQVNTKPKEWDNNSADLKSKLEGVKKFIKDRNNSKVLESRWYNYGVAIDDVSQTATASANNVWPDTTVWVLYTGGTYAGPWIHSVSQILDPTSTWFNDYGTPNLKILQFMPYNLDSIGFYCFYYRPYPVTSVIDTLIFDVFVRNPATDPSGYWTSLTHFADTVRYLRVLFNTSTGILSFPYYRYTYLLDAAAENDTLSNGFNYFEIATTGFPQVNAGSKVGVRIRFKPGHSYTPYVDSIANLNHMRFISLEENGANTYPIYIKGDWNVSAVGHTDSWFIPSSSWNGREIPTWAFYEEYSYEDHLIDWLLTADYHSGIQDESKANINVYPNPAQDNLLIDIENSKADLIIYDIVGNAVLKTQLESLQNSVDITGLSPGMYIGQIIIRGQSSTFKVIIE